MKKNWIKILVMVIIFGCLIALDLVTKYVFDAKLSGGQTLQIIPGFIEFKIVYNYGAAWGILSGRQVFLIVLSFVFLAMFLVYYIKEKNKTWLMNITFAFLFAGCVGNLFDRLVFGYVRDMIQFSFWPSFPVFNFADVALTVGVVLFVIYLIIYFVKAKKAKND